jgi:hypothetical protein
MNSQATAADVAAFFTLLPVVAVGWSYVVGIILAGAVASMKKLYVANWVMAAIFCGPLALIALAGVPNGEDSTADRHPHR